MVGLAEGTPQSAHDFFGWRVCSCCQRANNFSTPDTVASPPSTHTCWPRTHVAARVVALLYIAGLHLYLTCISVDDNGVIQWWRTYFLYATNWAFCGALVYFALINGVLCVVPPQMALLRPCGRRSDDIEEDVEEESSTRRRALLALLRACSASLHIAVVYQLVIVCMFWGTLPFSPAAKRDLRADPWVTIQTHGVVCVCVCADFFMTNVPVFVRDAWVCALVYVAYMTLNASYSLGTGNVIYDYLTWTEVKSVVVVACAAVLVGVFIGLVHLCSRMASSPPARPKKMAQEAAMASLTGPTLV
eukprot:GEMP01025775.1.p1 GENE.GEMP01025775.1~~GEMP01025775.1.p1  ORF type:complete len:303 (+),score=88.01 GEMP01025775.1:390-1298(+)